MQNRLKSCQLGRKQPSNRHIQEVSVRHCACNVQMRLLDFSLLWMRRKECNPLLNRLIRTSPGSDCRTEVCIDSCRRRLGEDACLNKPHCLPASTEYGSSERDSCGDLYEKAAKEMLARLQNMIPINPRAMWVGTFHGLCNRLLRLHHQEAAFRRRLPFWI